MNYNKKLNLKNKLSFIIGGNGLIGKEVSLALSEFNSKVIILDISKDNLIKDKKKHKNIYLEYLDVSKIEELELSIKNLVSKYGCPDIFINCAYTYDNDYINNTFNKLELNSFIKNINNLLVSPSWLSVIIAKYMKKSKKNGSIINFGSIYGVVGQNLNIYKNTQMKENVTYSIAKAGIINFTRQMTSYYGKYNIRINTISPGGIKGSVAGLKNKQNKNF